jgi:pimeloyl-ACP methyl ester carboxylesterase
MMASWNGRSILHNDQSTTSWNILPFVKEYDGLKNTLINVGYEEGKNLFIWPYDWRKPIDTISQQLDEFLKATVIPQNPSTKINIIGHSLGGLVARTWSQTNENSNSIRHLVTVGTPNKGIVQPYYAWEGGVMALGNSLISLAGQMIIHLNKQFFPLAKNSVQQQLPVLRDMLPTEPYLRKSDGSLIPQSQMSLWNTWLSDKNISFPPLFPLFTALRGIDTQTPYQISVISRNWLEEKLGLWSDGKPVSQVKDDGDGVVASLRASFQEDPAEELSKGHSELISDKEGVTKILQILEIPLTEISIIAGSATRIRPSLLFLLHSPATLSASYNGTIINDFDGILYFPNAQDGTYIATVSATSSGPYLLTIGQFGNDTTLWNDYSGTINTGVKDTYVLSFSSQSPKPDPVINLTDTDRLDELEQILKELGKKTKSLWVQKALLDLKLARSALAKKSYVAVRIHLDMILIDISRLWEKDKEEVVRFSFSICDSLTHAYQQILGSKPNMFPEKALKILQKLVDEQEKSVEKKIQKEKSPSMRSLLLLYEGKMRKEEGQKSTEAPRKSILLYTALLLFHSAR